jgi:hypothetical protein
MSNAWQMPALAKCSNGNVSGERRNWRVPPGFLPFDVVAVPG